MQREQDGARSRADETEAQEEISGGMPDMPPQVDGRDDEEKLRENRENLGVDEEHKTPDMKEHHRGTFP